MTDSTSGKDPDHPGPEQPAPEPGPQPPAYPGYGQQPGAGAPSYGAPPGTPTYGSPASGDPGYGPPAYPAYGAYGAPVYGGPTADPDKRPGGVTAACVLTWVFGGIVLLSSAFLLFSAVAARDDFIREVEQDDRSEDLEISADTLADVIAGVSIATLALSLLAIVLAVMAYQRSRAGRVGLILLSVVTAILALPASIGVVGVPWLIASIAAAVLLAGKSAGDWYNRRGAAQPYGPGPGGPGSWSPPGAPQA
jgi:hypothetical protein